MSAPYRAPRWLPGPHLQTIYPALFVPRPAVRYQRQRWDTPDGDFIDLDWLESQPSAISNQQSAKTETPPLVVLFHGLEGGSHSHYAKALMAALLVFGWRGVVVHFRGCSGEPNRLRRAYHSGDSAEINWVLRRLHSEQPAVPLFAVGVSLGGNALLRWLGEQQSAAGDVIQAAAAISAPLDLMAAGNALDSGFNLIYARNFLQTMQSKTLEKLERFPDICGRNELLAAKTLRAFDNIVTAPLHGYRDTDDYWTRASSKPLLRDIQAPTLLINARNDPFLPAWALPSPDEVAPQVTLDFPDDGGHTGFVTGAFPGNLGWLPQRILHFFKKIRADA